MEAAQDDVNHDGPTADPESAESVSSRRRLGKRLIIGALVLVVLAQIATFVSRARTEAAGSEVHTYLGVEGSDGENYIQVNARVLEVQPVAGTQQVRLTIVPHGSFANRDGSLTQTINLDADGYVGGSINLAGGEIPPPVQLVLDLSGDLSQYPFDSYSSALEVHLSKVQKGTDIAKSLGKGLGVVAADINNDGRMDLFVANDTVQNFLFVNRGPDKNNKWQFEEMALAAEIGYSEGGRARSGMGVDAADVFNTGYQDLFVANVDQEMFSLYRNAKNETFRDVAHANQVAQSTRLLSGWGLKFFDYDNDGAMDLILANGHPDDMIENYSAQVKYAEPILLFHQEDGKLKDVSAEAGPAFTKSYPARGLAAGDFNNDGRIDILIATNGGAPVLLKNRSGEGNHWLGLKLEGVTCNRDAIGAKLRWSAGGVIRTLQKNSGGSYLSSHDPRVVLGVGKAEKIDWVEITWPQPSGKVQRIENPAPDRYMTVRES